MFKTYDETKNKLVWRLWLILLVEFVGTFLMVLEIIAPSSFRLNDNHIYNMIFGSYIMKAVWVSTFIYILILLFRKISVNLNPAVTLAEVAAGNTSIYKAGLMIIAQFAGALFAGESAYLIANAIGAWDHSNPLSNSLDAVAPRLVFDGPFMNLLGVNPTIVESWVTKPPHGFGWLFGIVPFLIEFVLMYGLLASVIYGKSEITSNIRPIIIFATLTVVVALGIPTLSIAINPARLYGAAIATQINGGAHTLQYTWIYLFGELSAVYLFFVVENVKNEKSGSAINGVKKQLRVSYAENLALNKKYEWILDGNKPLEQMNKDDLLSASKKLDFDISKTKSRDEIEYNFIEYLIFGKEELNKVINDSDELTIEINNDSKIVDKKFSKFKIGKESKNNKEDSKLKVDKEEINKENKKPKVNKESKVEKKDTKTKKPKVDKESKVEKKDTKTKKPKVNKGDTKEK